MATKGELLDTLNRCKRLKAELMVYWDKKEVQRENRSRVRSIDRIIKETERRLEQFKDYKKDSTVNKKIA